MNVKLDNVSGPADLRKGKITHEKVANVVIASIPIKKNPNLGKP